MTAPTPPSSATHAAGHTASVAQVRPSAFDAWRKAAAEESATGVGSVVVLDVREPWERQTACITEDGFELVEIPMNEIVARVGQLDPDVPVACLCHHGARSQRVAEWLVQQGFAEVVNLAGGIDLWSRERDATVARY